MAAPDQRPRWRYRFDNFNRAFTLLREAIDEMEVRELTQLEREGLIQRFEYTWELAWKTLRDFLEYQGVVLPTVTPMAVIKAGYQADVISRGDDWMDALDARNKMAHTHSFQVFEQVVADIRNRYLGLLDSLHDRLLHEALAGDDGG